jgi:hypothetical protein
VWLCSPFGGSNIYETDFLSPASLSCSFVRSSYTFLVFCRIPFSCSVVYLPRVLEKLIYLHTGLDDIYCFKFDRTFIKYIEISSWVVIVVYDSSIIIMVTCTIYISCKITVMRRRLKWTDSNVFQKRNKKSAIIVIAICIVFLLSESITWLERTFDVSVGQYFGDTFQSIIILSW